jgi:signal transduction histidine kinase
MPAQLMESRELDRLTRELALRKRLQDALLLFSRSISARLTLETALESLVVEAGTLFGVRRASVWLHDRVARTLVLSASSDARDQGSAARIPTSESSPVARGLRVEAPELSGDGDAQCLVMSLRGWRRALGTLVIEGRPTRVEPDLFVELSGDFARQLGAALERVLILEDHLRDTAAQAQLRTRLAHSERMASLGQFVAGIAHEMNNPLQGVLGFLELMLRDAPPGSPLQHDLQRVFNEAERAALTVLNLLVFTGRQQTSRDSLLLADLVDETMALREGTPDRAPVPMRHRRAAHLPAVMGDRVRLQQALLNIIINAEHAIAASRSPGEITVTTRIDGSHIVIHIEDTGPGIPADVLPRIFEPFFTTKEAGQGTGLGLAITYGIVQDHGGAITAATSARGAAFTILLPVADDKVTSTGP